MKTSRKGAKPLSLRIVRRAWAEARMDSLAGVDREAKPVSDPHPQGRRFWAEYKRAVKFIRAAIRQCQPPLQDFLQLSE